jgi:hypothetical protein
MFKKLLIPFILALVVALPLSGVAYAANESSVGITRYVGTILYTDPAAMTFKLDTLAGEHLTIHVADTTIYAGGVTSLADLQPAMYVNVIYRQLKDGSYLADHVLVHPRANMEMTLVGQVTAVNDSSFTMLGHNGITYTFNVNHDTPFTGLGVAHARELSIDDQVRVTFRELGNGQYNVFQVMVIRYQINIPS